jgi:hypothetical protein
MQRLNESQKKFLNGFKCFIIFVIQFQKGDEMKIGHTGKFLQNVLKYEKLPIQRSMYVVGKFKL